MKTAPGGTSKTALAGADSRAVVEALSDPATYPGAPPVEVRETHISWVFLAGDRAYKLKKPLVLPFLDYGTRERRRLLCEEEVRLNRRLAPSVYRGVRAVIADGRRFRLERADHPRAVEHVVAMRRFDERDTLPSVLARGALSGGGIDALGGVLARFHAAAPVAEGIDPVTAAAASDEETFDSLSDLAPPELLPLLVSGRRFARTFLEAHAGLLRERAGAGLVREGHGDLRAEHVLVRGPLEVIDCLEFDPALRTVDVGADLAFLVMDLERLGERAAAARLVQAYRRAGGDPGSDALIAFHASERAAVRAKVALVRGRQPGADRARAEAGATHLLELARQLGWRARRPLLLVTCGLSGTGKSTLARELAELSMAPVLAADVVRKQLASLAPGERAGPERYSDETSRRTYAELGRRAAREMARSGAVIVDATFRRSADRAAFEAELGRPERGEMRLLECVAPLAVRKRRAAERALTGTDPSDATPAVVAAQEFDPLPAGTGRGHLVLPGDLPLGERVGRVDAWLDGAAD